MSSYYHYPVWLRIWHLLNALCFLTLIVTGLSMAYQVPEIRFDYVVTIHNTTGIILSINYLIFMILHFITKNNRFYKFKLNGLTKDLTKQIQYYSKDMFKGKPHPFPVNENRKFNPLQQISYIVVLFIFVPLIIVSGWFLIFPQLIFHSLFGIPGLVYFDQVHVIAAYFAFMFMCIHIYFCTIGVSPLSNFRSMITGWHESH